MRADEHQRASRESTGVGSGKISPQFPMLLLLSSTAKAKKEVFWSPQCFQRSDLIDLKL
jgi:hypothetical protein